jgi:hypothetical protein
MKQSNKHKDVMEKKECIICQSKKYRIKQSIWFEYSYSFLDNFPLITCIKCEYHYVTCPKCGEILFILHLPLDPFGVRSICPSCEQKFPKIKKWAQKQVYIFSS